MGAVGGVIRVGELVILGFEDADKAGANPAPEAEPLGRLVTLHVGIKELVVPQLVGGDLEADLTQYRLVDRLGERAVKRAGPRLDDAAGDQFAGPRPAHRIAGRER